MSNLQTEELITLADAAALIPRRRMGRPAHPSTLFRWADAGLRGIRLETIQVGGTKCTSRAALFRFFAALDSGTRPTDREGPRNA